MCHLICEAIVICLKVLLAIILPPVAVLIERGCFWEFCLSILLTLLGWIPGVIYALIVIFTDHELRHRTAQPEVVVV